MTGQTEMEPTEDSKKCGKKSWISLKPREDSFKKTRVSNIRLLRAQIR